jgi:Ser/Thr protein kinase RdoA (MazF antagonist)
MFQPGVAEAAGLSAPHLRMSEDEAAALVAERFGIVGRASRFAAEKDDTFRIQAADGAAYVLKASNPGEDAAEIDLQLALLEHVRRADPSLPVPRVVRDLDGGRLLAHADRAGQSRSTRLLTYMGGTLLSDMAPSVAEREKVGEMQARLRLAMADFSHPADGRRLPWDMRHLLGLEPLLAHIEAGEQRTALRRGLDRFAAIEPKLAACRRQVLHNDFSRGNILVDRDADAFVTGIIDFGDAVRTAIAIDVSTTLANQFPAAVTADLFGDGRDVVRGYLRVADLTEQELVLIPHLAMARLVGRILLTVWRSKLFTDNVVYIMRNTHQSWAQLDWFLERPVEEVSAQLLTVGMRDASRSGPNDRNLAR